MTLPAECTDNLAALLAILPEEERPAALQVLREVPYPATRLLKACRDGGLDRWQLATALRRFKEDCQRHVEAGDV